MHKIDLDYGQNIRHISELQTNEDLIYARLKKIDIHPCAN